MALIYGGLAFEWAQSHSHSNNLSFPAKHTSSEPTPSRPLGHQDYSVVLKHCTTPRLSQGPCGRETQEDAENTGFSPISMSVQPTPPTVGVFVLSPKIGKGQDHLWSTWLLYWRVFRSRLEGYSSPLWRSPGIRLLASLSLKLREQLFCVPPKFAKAVVEIITAVTLLTVEL